MDVLTRLVLLIGWIVVSAGCTEHENTLVSLGSGNAVNSEWLDTVAKEKGQTREQTIKEMRVNAAAKRISNHAEKYGITEDEAREQLAFADEHETIPFLKALQAGDSLEVEQK